MYLPGSVHTEDEFLIFVETSSPLHGSKFVSEKTEDFEVKMKPRNEDEAVAWPLNSLTNSVCVLATTESKKQKKNQKLCRRIKQSSMPYAFRLSLSQTFG